MIRSAQRHILLTGLSLLSSALAASTPAGTVITNQASATFDPARPGEVSSALSNLISTTVQAVCALSVTPLGLSPSILPGERATLRFTVTNAGNDTFELPLSVSSSGMTPAPALALYLDENGNGQLDAGEAPISRLSLAPDAAAQLLVVMQSSDAAQGDALVNLLTSCGAGHSTSAAGTVRLGPPPVLAVHKTFTPSLVRPGNETTVQVSASNDGQGESREVVLTDLLTEQLAQGLTYVPGSARASLGTLEYTSDGTSWSTQETLPVRGVRVRVPTLASGAQINLTFRMLAAESADGKVISNTATAQTGSKTTSDTAQVDVRYQPGVAIGPVGNPLAPEGSAADSQSRPFAAVGQQVCFDHTLQNTGDVRDTFTLTLTYPQGAATATLTGPNGKAFQPLPLDPGQTALVRVCYTPSQAGVLGALLTATGTRGESNATRDQIADIQNGLPELKKSYAASGKTAGGQPRPISEGDTVALGDTITYTLSVHNPYTRALADVVVSDPVPAHVDVVSASASGVVSGAAGAQTVTWNVGTLAAGETRTFTVVTTVSDRAQDGEALKNAFNMVSSEFPAPLSSNEVVTPVWNAVLNVEKAVSTTLVTYGDKVTYTLTIHNTSPVTAIESALITDMPAAGLQYLPGSSKLNGQPLGDPELANQTMQWTVGSIPAGGQIVIVYDMRVTPDAPSHLLNEVQVVGVGAGGTARAIASNRASRTVHLDPLKFAPLGDILGTVFVDRNRNGIYDAGLDTPIERARVVLAGGRLVLTDAAGRYHFSNVPYGSWALRLDPNTVPYPPLKVPQDGGMPGTRTVQVSGSASADFPLAPLAGDIAALRRTSLTVGPLSLEKVVSAKADGYSVTLSLRSAQALPGFHLEDPLPAGAVLKEGRNTLDANLPAGETKLTYRFTWNGEARAATTDPVVSWRY